MIAPVSLLAAPAIRGLSAYDPGHDLPALRRRFGGRLVELGSNESPYGPGPAARAALAMPADALALYPDPQAQALREAIAARHGLGREQVSVGNGSHELLMLLGQCFLSPEVELVCSRYAFAVFAIAARACGAGLRIADALPAEHPDSRGHDLDALAAAVGPRTRLVCIANPNNPTGTRLPDAALRRFAEALPAHCLLLVDEAYYEYQPPGTASAADWLAELPNLVVTRTFSKAHGLAGLRLGYALSSPEVAEVLDRLRESFNTNHLAQVAGLAALADTQHLDRVREANALERDWLRARLIERGLRVAASHGNFLLVDFGAPAAAVEQGLLDAGVVVRPMAGYGLAQCLRISVGLRAQHERLLDALDPLLETANRSQDQHLCR